MPADSRQTDLFDLIGSAEDSPAKTYRWLDDVLDWLERAADSGSCSDVSLLLCVPAGFSSKTSLACCRQTADGTWESSSGRWGNWAIGGPTACLTLSGSEFPSGAVACSLSDVLEKWTDGHFTCEADFHDYLARYFLSAKACRGILRRAEKRGRELPPALLAALQAAAESTPPEDAGRMT
jgi:hypothetical protein